jgi:hypothetical protein
VLGILMGFWLSQRLLARVRAVSIECERILGGDLTRRLPVTWPSASSRAWRARVIVAANLIVCLL